MTIDLDHVAIAAHRPEGPLRELITNLGAAYFDGGPAVGFEWRQVRLGPDGMVVEVLGPHRVEENDFLARFLERRGEGPHHLTFKVPDIRQMLARLGEAGLQVASVDLSDPEWQEAFLMPASAGGTVVQVAQKLEPADSAATSHRSTRPADLPQPGGVPVTLRRVVLATPELDAPLLLYRDLLGGVPDAEGPGWIELVWPGGGRLRFEEAEGALPGIVRLECEGGEGERVIAGTRFVLGR